MLLVVHNPNMGQGLNCINFIQILLILTIQIDTKEIINVIIVSQSKRSTSQLKIKVNGLHSCWSNMAGKTTKNSTAAREEEINLDSLSGVYETLSCGLGQFSQRLFR